VEQSGEAGKAFAYWQMRCELVAPEPVRDAIARIVPTNDDPSARAIAHENLKASMRADLRIAR
jgi:hypothetical protein